ncbi:hypothetical protein PIROE2DRAFT_14929 [Piromyces sp. E2]|nr:hypothetical protein PIROE2DRAFT_14929 [Piromyces sp. E2]|eukprot:OUM59520.1 hypothetical protein PIROE2DRAFT_14929 [Piromyces sp. E2]
MKSVYTNCLQSYNKNQNKNDYIINFINAFNINEKINNPDGLSTLIADLHNNNIDVFFMVSSEKQNGIPYDIPYILTNFNNLDFYTEIELSKEGLTNEGDFTNEEEYNEHLNKCYKESKKHEEYIRNILKIFYGTNEGKVESMAKSIIDIEKKFARINIDHNIYSVPIYSKNTITNEIFDEIETGIYNNYNNDNYNNYNFNNDNYNNDNYDNDNYNYNFNNDNYNNYNYNNDNYNDNYNNDNYNNNDFNNDNYNNNDFNNDNYNNNDFNNDNYNNDNYNNDNYNNDNYNNDNYNNDNYNNDNYNNNDFNNDNYNNDNYNNDNSLFTEVLQNDFGDDYEDKSLNKIEDFNEKYPLINWKLYFEKRFEQYGFEIPINKELFIKENNDFNYLYKYLNEIDSEDLTNYIIW